MSFHQSAFEFDVAISYAGPDRTVAEDIARHLRDRGLSVFFDLFEQGEVWGKRLYAYLADVYENKALYCVVLISESYRDRMWPRHELQAAFNRAVRQREDYILPVRLDDSAIDGLPKDLAYLSIRDCPPREIANLLFKKLRQATTPSASLIGTSSPALEILWDRNSALNSVFPDVEKETKQIWIVSGPLFHSSVESDSRIISLLREKSLTPELRINIMMPGPNTAELRALQENRAPGALIAEQKVTIEFIRAHLPAARLRLLRVAPVYFAILLTDSLLYNPYTYTREAFSSLSMVIRRQQDSELLFDRLARDITGLWEMAYLVGETDDR